jgi:hypothetical protein
MPSEGKMLAVSRNMKSGVSLLFSGLVVMLALAGGSTLADIAEQDGWQQVAPPTYAADNPVPSRVSEMSAPGLPTSAAKKHVFLLLGGLRFMNGWAASVASAGMLRLQSSLAALPDVEVTVYDWRSFKEAGDDIALLPKDDIVIVIGYSGGGSRATWLANLPSEPKIDLMILYDPSPSWDMKVIGPNVKQAICYRNLTPFFFGLGGGVLVGNNTQIDTIDINENHMLVQTDTTLHQRTITEVKKIHR